jgi:hypothetical protein
MRKDYVYYSSRWCDYFECDDMEPLRKAADGAVSAREKYEEAVRVIELAVEKEFNRMRNRIATGVELLKLGDIREALNVFEGNG